MAVLGFLALEFGQFFVGRLDMVDSFESRDAMTERERINPKKKAGGYENCICAFGRYCER